jgi:hypothetical protein
MLRGATGAPEELCAAVCGVGGVLGWIGFYPDGFDRTFTQGYLTFFG